MILSDINMPEMDGLTLLNKVRDTHQDIRTVVITAYGDMKNIRQAMNLGAFDILNKPIDFQDLEVTITRTLDESRKSKEYNFLMKQAKLESKPLENGTALGLCISRQIVEQKHSGKLSCTSVPFEGTEFIIQIPI